MFLFYAVTFVSVLIQFVSQSSLWRHGSSLSSFFTLLTELTEWQDGNHAKFIVED